MLIGNLDKMLSLEAQATFKGDIVPRIKILFQYRQGRQSPKDQDIIPVQALPPGISQGTIPRIWSNSVTTNNLSHYKSWHQENGEEQKLT
jgi:hypothetical protein